jgi:hypothetical protein
VPLPLVMRSTFTTASASSRALRRRSWASSNSGRDKDAALAKRPVNQRARHAVPSRRLFLGDHDDIDGDAQWGKSVSQAHHLVELALHLGLDHEEVEVAVVAAGAARPRSKEDDPRRRTGGRRQTPASILDHGIINHGRIVAAASELSLGGRRPGKAEPERERCLLRDIPTSRRPGWALVPMPVLARL